MSRRMRARLGTATGAVVANGLQAAASLGLQIVVARELGVVALGTFVLLHGLLITLNSAQAGLRDALIVYDRRDPTVSGALAWLPAIGAVGAGFLCAGGVVAAVLLSAGPASLFGLVLILWLLKEVGRRLLMALHRFWALVANDVAYVTGVAVWLLLAPISGRELSLMWCLSAMAVGSAVSVGVALIQIPTAELPRGRLTRRGAYEVIRFAAWRSAQGGLHPLTLFLSRALVATVASPAALGRLEAARLLIGPILVLVNGAGDFLLPHYRRASTDRDTRSRGLRGPSVALVAACALWGTLSLLFLDELTALLTAGRFTISPWALLGWLFFAAAFAAGISAGTMLIAHRYARTVFGLRALGFALALGAVAGLIPVLGPSATPYALAGGMCISAALLWRRALTAPMPAFR